MENNTPNMPPQMPPPQPPEVAAPEPGKPWYKRWWGIVIIFFLAVAIINGLAGGGGDENVAVEEAAEEVEVVEETTTTTTEAPEITLTVEEQLALDLKEELGLESDRDIDPKTIVEFDAEDTPNRVLVRFAKNQAVLDTKSEILGDIQDAMTIIAASEYDFSSISFEVSYPLVDNLGNVTEADVVYAIWDRELIDQIDFDSGQFDVATLFDNNMGIVWTHPALAND